MYVFAIDETRRDANRPILEINALIYSVAAINPWDKSTMALDMTKYKIIVQNSQLK